MTARSSADRLSPKSLYASLFVPDFPVAVLREGGGPPRPSVAAWGQAPNRFVYAADALARQCGVRECMALAAAQARCGTAGDARALRVFERDTETERRVQRRLLALAESATPRFEDVSPGVLTLDFAGLREPYATAERLAAGAARLGLQANVGVSRNRFVAMCAARTQRGVTHVYPGQEAGFLRALPVDALPLNAKETETLARWGVRRVGELERLPPAQLAERFGERGARMARLARGREDSLLSAYQPPLQLELGQDFDWEVGELEPLVLAIAGLLDRICLQLQGLDRAAARLSIRLQLVGGGAFERVIALPAPLSDARVLLKLARIDLSAHPPAKAVEGVRVSAEPVERRRLQESLFEPGLPNSEELAVTLVRLDGLVGNGRFGTPVVPDTHRPGAAAVKAFRAHERVAARRGTGSRPGPARAVPNGEAMDVRQAVSERSAGARVAPAATPLRSALVFRCFRPSRQAAVTLLANRPAHVDAPDVHGAVTACAGPWHVSGEWWTPDGWQYQEWDIEVQGRLYRAGCERATGEWFLAGEYD